MAFNDPTVRGQNIDIEWKEYYAIQQVLLEFCDYYDAKACGNVTMDEFAKCCHDLLAKDVRFEWPDFPKKGRTHGYNGVEDVINKWFGTLLANTSRNAFHQPGPIQVIRFTRGKEALVRQRILYNFVLIQTGEMKEYSENVVWKLRYEKDGQWRITLLQNDVGMMDRKARKPAVSKPASKL